MIAFNDYVPTEKDKDMVKLAIMKLLFNDSLNLDEANFVNLKDGTKEFKVVLKPKVNEDKNEDIEENYKKEWSRWND